MLICYYIRAHTVLFIVYVHAMKICMPIHNILIIHSIVSSLSISIPHSFVTLKNATTKGLMSSQHWNPSVYGPPLTFLILQPKFSQKLMRICQPKNLLCQLLWKWNIWKWQWWDPVCTIFTLCRSLKVDS